MKTRILQLFILTFINYTTSKLPSFQPPCGCVFDYIEGNLTHKQVILPAVSIDANVKVSTNLASTNLKFTYENPSDKDINIKFKFPTDVNTAIYKVLVKYENGDQFEANIEEKEEAKKIYNEAKKAGKKATLVETDKTQDDILLINLANIPANQSATVEITTAQILKLSNGYLKYKLATSLFTRYDPSLKEGITIREKLSKNFPSLFDNATNHIVKPKFKFHMEFDALNDLDFNSMDDIIFSEEFLQKTGKQLEELNSGNVFKKDNDVEVMFKSKQTQNTFVTKEDLNQKGYYIFSHFIETSEFDQIDVSNTKPLEYILVVDNSGSMGTERMNQAKDACKQIINSLPENSGFNIIKFGSDFDQVFDNSVEYTDANKKIALEYIGRMSSDMGGTEILPAMKVAMCEDKKCVDNLKSALSSGHHDKISDYSTELQESDEFDFTNYRDHMNVGYVLKPSVENANRVTINLSAYSIEYNGGCSYDAFTIRAFKDGKEMEESRQIICGNGAAQTFVIENFDEIKLGFYSDSSKTDSGFTVTWSSEYDDSLDTEGSETPAAVLENPYHEIKQVFVITDGDVSNQDQIFAYVNSQKDKMRVFGVGIGAGASTSLVNGISERGNGFASFVSEKENTFYEVESLTQVVVKGIMAASKGFIADVQLNGAKYPGYVDTAITSGAFIHVMVSEDALQNEAISNLQYSFKNIDNIEGETKNITIDHNTLTRVSALHVGGVIAIMAKKDLQQTQKEYEGLDYSQQTEKEELKQKMVNLSKASNVLCPRTAFVGVMVDKDGVEKNNSSSAVDINISAEYTEDMGYNGPQYKSLSMPISRMSGSNMYAQNRMLSGSSYRISGGSSYSSNMAVQSRPVAYSLNQGPPPSPAPTPAPTPVPATSALTTNAVHTTQGLPMPSTEAATSVARMMAATSEAQDPVPIVTPGPEADMATEATEAVEDSVEATTLAIPDPTTTTTAPTTTTTTIVAGLEQLNSYLDLTNSQSVSGSWNFDDIEDYIQSEKLDQLKNLSSFDQNDISTVSGIILLQEKFSSEKQDWSASADKAWDSMTFTSRMTARSLIQQVISILEFNLSVFDVVM